MIARVHHLIGKIAVIGHQQKAFRVSVQPPDRIDPGRRILHQLCHTAPVQLVIHRRHVSPRLMQCQIDFLQVLAGIHSHPLHCNDVSSWVNFLSDGRFAAVDGYLSLFDIVFCFPP